MKGADTLDSDMQGQQSECGYVTGDRAWEAWEDNVSNVSALWLPLACLPASLPSWPHVCTNNDRESCCIGTD